MKRGFGIAAVLGVTLAGWVALRSRSASHPTTTEPAPSRSPFRTRVAALRPTRPLAEPLPAIHKAGEQAVRGMVRDVRGAPIAGAVITLGGFDPVAASTPDGTFEAWLPVGSYKLTARAAGFADRTVYGAAPDPATAVVAIELTPESVIAGIVVDAETKRPIADALVTIDDRTERTGSDGRFRIDRLEPGRYTPTATAIGAYGETAESVLAGFGATVPAVTIELHPVAVVAGHIVVAANPPRPCPPGDGEVMLVKAWSSQPVRGTTLDDGFVVLEGVSAGEYEATVSCKGFLSAVPYPNVVVGDSDVEDVTWPVHVGARITGHVKTTAGVPVADATVNTRGAGGQTFASATTDARGAFLVEGVAPGAVEVLAAATGFQWSEAKSVIAAIAAPAPVELVLEPSPPDPPVAKPAKRGTLAGRVRTSAGAAVPDAYVELDADDRARRDDTPGPLLVASDGSFRFTGLAEGTYSVRAYRVSADETRLASVTTGARVELVLDPTGEIVGTVTTPDGAPVEDAIIGADGGSAMQQTREEHVFHTHGAFAFRDLPPGTYELTVDGNERAMVSITIAAGEHRTGVHLISEPRYSLRGRLASPSGAPLAGWRVELDYTAHTVQRGSGSTVVISDVITAVTDASGTFLLNHIPAGPATMSAANVAVALDAAALPLPALTVSPDHLDLGTLTVSSTPSP